MWHLAKPHVAKVILLEETKDAQAVYQIVLHQQGDRLLPIGLHVLIQQAINVPPNLLYVALLKATWDLVNPLVDQTTLQIVLLIRVLVRALALL